MTDRLVTLLSPRNDMVAINPANRVYSGLERDIVNGDSVSDQLRWRSSSLHHGDTQSSLVLDDLRANQPSFADMNITRHAHMVSSWLDSTIIAPRPPIPFASLLSISSNRRREESRVRPSLCSLPIELIYSVVSFLDWTDAIALGQTNCRYHDVVSSYAVWLNAARKHADMYYIPHHTFPLDTLSVTGLQHTIAHTSQIRSACRNQLSLYTKSVHEHDLPADMEELQSATLIPGGRWLLTGHRDGELIVWDLNHGPDKTDIHKVQSTRVKTVDGPVGVLLIQRSEDNQGVVALTESYDHFDPFTYHLGITRFQLLDDVRSSTGSSAAVSKNWSSFSGNDTIALEGEFVAAVHQGLTRVWNWKQDTYTAFQWEINIDATPEVAEHLERIDIAIQPPYVYLLHSRLRIFAAFKIPPMGTRDPIIFNGVVKTIRPSIIVSLEPSNIIAVQFANPWTLQRDYSDTPTLPFFLNTLDPETLTPQLLRYDVQIEDLPGMGPVVRPPTLKQRIGSLPESLSYDIISPTIVADDFGTFWISDAGLLYAPDKSQDRFQNHRNGSEVGLDVLYRIVAADTSPFFARHRVGMDIISGKRVKVGWDKIYIDEYAVPSFRVTPLPMLPMDFVDE